MIKFYKGTTRLVFEFTNIVIKIPNIFRYYGFLRGIISNNGESTLWKWNSGDYENGHSYLLAPVIWCSFGSLVLIMKRADRFTSIEEWEKINISNHLKYFKGDDTIDNYGIINNRVVKIDYGNIN